MPVGDLSALNISRHGWFTVYARTATARKSVSIDGAEIAAKLPTVSGLAAAKKAAEDAIKALPKASAVELADKDVIVAAWELAKAYDDMAGVNTMVTSMSGQLGALKTAIKNDLTKQLALADQTDKTALRAIDDNVTAFKDMMKEDQALETVAEDYTLAGLSTAIDKVKTTEANAVKALIAKIPVNVTEADKATVQAARAAYDAYVADWTDYFDFANGYAADDMGAALRTLLLAEASLGLNYDAEENAKAYVQDLKIAARSVKTSKGVKVTINADVQPLLDAGFTVEYKFYRSTKSNKNFGTAKVTKTTNTYLNTSGVKGTKYYYKAKLVVKNAAGEVVATTPLTQCLYATRTF